MKIRKIFHLSLIVVVTGVLASCEIADYDNFDKPKTDLTGAVLYDGDTVGVRNGHVQLELWQPGYADYEKIPVFLDQDGSYQAKLFSGNYKLTQLAGSGPWVTDTDSIDINLQGDQSVNMEVEPYYWLEDVSISQSGGNAVEADFTVTEVNGSLDLEFAILYVAETAIVDGFNNAGFTTKAPADITLGSSTSISHSLPAELADRDYIFARVGVKTAGVPDLLYSDVVKLQL